MDTTTQISNKLSNQILEDLFITAMDVAYGGSNHWGRFQRKNKMELKAKYNQDDLPTAEYLWAALLAGETVIIADQESSETWELTLDKIKEGTEAFATKYVAHFTDALRQEGDAETADVWFQVCVLGKLTFG